MAAPPKPFRAEYAKSNRSTCKTCKNTITKDSFRIAKVVPATQFDGFMPMWHHGNCILKKKGQMKSLDDVEGVDNLRWEDQLKIRKYIEGDVTATQNNDNGGPGGIATSNENGEYAIEIAKSSRSSCKSCNEKIEKGQRAVHTVQPQNMLEWIIWGIHPYRIAGIMHAIHLSQMELMVSRNLHHAAREKHYLVRVSIMVSPDSGKFRGKVPAWRHAKCFFELDWWKQPIEEIPGWEDLPAEDQEATKMLCQTSGLLEGKFVDKMEEVTKKKGAKRKGLKEEQSSSPNNTDGQNKRSRKGDSQPISRTVPEPTAGETREHDKQLEKQSKALWDIKDNLKKYVDTSAMRLMLEENGQNTSGSEYDLRERCADGMLFGALGSCPTCGGFLEYHGGQYRCMGNISEWSKCTYMTDCPERLKRKWKIPEGLDNDYLKKWFRSQKANKEKRILPTTGSGSVKKTVESSGTKKNLKGDILDGVKIVIVGKEIKAKWRQQILAKGGQILNGLSSDINCVVTNEEELEIEENKPKFQDALNFRVPIVKENFLEECLKKGALMPVKQYLIETTGKFSTIMKVKVKGRSAVHEESCLQDVGHILEVGKTIFNTTLNLSDLSTGVNSYYILQIIENDNKNVYHLFRRWGRIGNAKIGGIKNDKMPKSDAIREFKRLFREKTGNEWEAWENKTDFHKQPKKFYPLEIDYGVNSSHKDIKPLGTRSKLDPRVVSLMKMLFDIETYRAAMMEFEINMSEMPLGKLSRRNIDQAFQVLTEVQNILASDGQSDKTKSLLVDASNRFFTLVPHVHPQIICDEETLKSKIDMLEALRDIELASKLIGSTGEDTDEDPLDINYKKLKCNIVPLSHDSDDFQLVKKYLDRTHAPTHTEWGLELQDVFTVAREGEEDAFRSKKEKLGNQMLLWHGSRTTNYVGILSQGLRIAPPEAPVTGYMFGKGVYFADLVSKSAQYCYTTASNPTGIMLLSEVALGEMYELKEAKYMDKPPRGKHSTKGVGKTKPLETEFETWNGEVRVPCGRPVPSGVPNTSLLYNEYIVYDTSQINLRFLLKVKFKYKRSR